MIFIYRGGFESNVIHKDSQTVDLKKYVKERFESNVIHKDSQTSKRIGPCLY